MLKRANRGVLEMANTAAITSARYDVSTGFTPADMLVPSAFPHPVVRLEVRETNISWVILTGPYAYKIKKSVRLDFLDASTLARRLHLCEEELRLNRRLAGDLYLDVVAITQEADGIRIAGFGPAIEYAVRMKQFEASEELSALLEHSRVGEQECVDLGQRLARFHGSAAQAPFDENFPHTRHLHDAVLGNLAALLSHLDADAALPEMGTLIDWTHDYLHDSLVPLRMREQTGAIRECHGDLHARNVVRWNGQLIPFDCLEFDPILRWIDVMNDVAFLVMDLTAHGRKDLAFAFLNAYLERTGDYDGVRHLSFYSVYRALVRAMVDSLSAERDLGHQNEFRDRLRMRVKAAAAYLARPAPTLFIMHGPSGSGKSWLSERLVPLLGAVRIRSDVERKRLAGIPASMIDNVGFEQGMYKPEISHRTYARLLECAEGCLMGGVDAIVDAAFLNGADRRSFRDMAMREGFGFIILMCEADSLALAERVQRRAQFRIDPSEAGVEVLNRQLLNKEPLGANERSGAIAVDTTDPQACQRALAAIRNRLASMSLNRRRPALPERRDSAGADPRGTEHR
jgi:aminoglycoside phosphotransferase family enzyme/predicted kinase